MFDSRKQNPNCNFSEEIISYIYDEINDSEKQIFEKHLTNCLVCIDEIKAFSSISCSINEWKNEEFAGLASPIINIPYESNGKIKTSTESEKSKKSWLQNLIDSFTISSSFIKTAGGFVILFVMIGIGWFLFGNLSDKNSQIVDDINSPKIEMIDSNEEQNENNPINKNELANKNEKDSFDKPNGLIVGKTPVKVIKAQNKISKNETEKERNNAPTKKVSKPNKVSKPKKLDNIDTKIQSIPRLSELAIDSTDEKDLSLTDLFDEVGSDK